MTFPLSSLRVTTFRELTPQWSPNASSINLFDIRWLWADCNLVSLRAPPSVSVEMANEWGPLRATVSGNNSQDGRMMHSFPGFHQLHRSASIHCCHYYWRILPQLLIEALKEWPLMWPKATVYISSRRVNTNQDVLPSVFFGAIWLENGGGWETHNKPRKLKASVDCKTEIYLCFLRKKMADIWPRVRASWLIYHVLIGRVVILSPYIFWNELIHTLLF